MDKGICTLYRKLTDINAKLCCLCYSHESEETACIQDVIVLSLNCDHDAKESSHDEEVEIHYILEQILGSKVAACLSEDDPICNQCLRSAISSYKFIKRCRENAKIMAYSVEAFTGTLEHTEGVDMQDYKTMFIFMDLKEPNCTQYYDTAQFADSNAALYKFQTLFRPYRTIIDNKGNTKYKCTKCQSVFCNPSSALTHFRVNHNDDQELCSKDVIENNLSDNDNEMTYSSINLSNDQELCLIDEMNNSLSHDDRMITGDIDDSQSSPDWTERYNRSNVKYLNKLSHEVVLDRDGVHKYKCKVCESIYSSAGGARRHYKLRHVLNSEKKDTNASRKRAQSCKHENDKTKAKKNKLDYLNEFLYCRDSVKHLNELSHTVIKDSCGATKYKCRECSSILSNSHAARKHYLKYHVKETKFEEDSHSKGDDSKSEKNKKNNTQDEYTCIYCDEKYDNKYILIEHLLKNHAFYNSKIRDETTLEDIHLLENDIYHHIYTTANDDNGCEKFCCKMCLGLFKSYQTVRAHFNKIHVQPQVEEEQYICSQCGKEFKTKQFLSKHEERHTDSKVMCATCLKEFKNKYSFAYHKCTFKAGYSKLAPRQTPRQKDDSQSNFICNECGNRYMNKDSLRSHIKRRHDPHSKKFPCLHCPKVFSERTGLKNHQVTHTRERNFTCDICGDVFVAKNALVYHTRIHTGERPYECSQCGMKFLNASRRTAHIKRHHIAAMATCSICGIIIKECGMRKHMTRHRIASSRPASNKTRSVLPVSRKGKRKASDVQSVGDGDCASDSDSV